MRPSYMVVDSSQQGGRPVFGDMVKVRAELQPAALQLRSEKVVVLNLYG